MKKLLILILTVATALGANAKFRWGPTVGANFSNFYWNQPLLHSRTLAGVSGGVMGEVMIPGIGFGVDMALKYTFKGAKTMFGEYDVWSSDGFGTETMRFHTIQIPVNLRFKWTRMNGFEHYLAPIVFGGPSFNFYAAHTDCKAVEIPAASVGLQCGIGAEVFERYQLTAGFLWDLSHDIRTVKLDDNAARMRGWFIDFAVLF